MIKWSKALPLDTSISLHTFEHFLCLSYIDICNVALPKTKLRIFQITVRKSSIKPYSLEDRGKF